MLKKWHTILSFVAGASGVQAVAAVIAQTLGNQREMQANLEMFCAIAARKELAPTLLHRCGSDELL